MLWSWWQYKPDGLRSPKRPRAWTNRHDARRSLSPRHQARGDLRLVALILRCDGDRVVPEFGVAALGAQWSLKCRKSGDEVTIYGEIPEALWYEERP